MRNLIYCKADWAQDAEKDAGKKDLMSARKAAADPAGKYFKIISWDASDECM
jgi:hypothetical protein